MNDQEAGYFAIIPADVRYDDDLIPNAKLLYGEITALCRKEGYCWATNKHFADLYGTSEKTITRWISNLEEKGYIGTAVQTFRYEDGTVKKVRYIYLDKNRANHPDKSVLDHTDKNVQDQPDKNVPYKSKVINNKVSNKKEGASRFTPPTIEEVKGYCIQRDNTIDPEAFIDFYESVGWKIGNKPMKDWQAAVRTWEKRRAEKHPKPKLSEWEREFLESFEEDEK